MRWTPALLVVSLVALPLQAQISGSINRDAPKVTNSIEMADGSKLTVNYTAVHFGEGKWAERFNSPEGRERLQKLAEQTPLGSVEVSMPVVAAGRTVAPGKYTMFFTLHESGTWVLNLKPGGEGNTIRWGLRLKDTEHEHTRLTVALMPAAKSGECNLTVAFGSKAVTVPVTPAEKKDGN